jgi:hypothetical protein
MYRIESQSWRRAATRSKTIIVSTDPPARGALRPRASRYRHSRPRPYCPASRDHPRRRHRLGGPLARSRHHCSRRNCAGMSNRGHRSASLGPQACWEQNHETCEQDLANHGTHLKAQPAGPFPKAFTNKKDAPNPVLVSILFPIPCSPHCAITVEPWNAPRSGSQSRLRPILRRPHLNPLRPRGIVRVLSLVPRILRGIVPSARSGWNRGAAS